MKTKNEKDILSRMQDIEIPTIDDVPAHSLARYQSPGDAPFGVICFGGLGTSLETSIALPIAEALQRFPVRDRPAVHYYEYHGTGHSSPSPVADWRLGAMLQDADQVLGAIGQPLIAAGHSIGGHVALSMAQRHPDKIHGLILYNPAWNLHTLDRITTKLTVIFRDATKALGQSSALKPKDIATAFVEEARQHSLQETVGDTGQNIIPVPCPVIVFQSQEDKIVEPAYSSALMERLDAPSKSCIPLNGLDHPVPSRVAAVRLVHANTRTVTLQMPRAS